MADAFDPDKADFSGMTGQKGLFFSAVLHKAFAAVDDDGTEAAAATAVVVEASSLRMEAKAPPVFRADHPFIYMIRDKNDGSILFVGRMLNPK